jgi:hypothetical protein
VKWKNVEKAKTFNKGSKAPDDDVMSKSRHILETHKHE